MNHVQERAHKVKALMRKGHKAAPWHIDQVREVYAREFGEDMPQAEVPVTPEPEPQPEPTPEPTPEPEAEPQAMPAPSTNDAKALIDLLSKFGGQAMDESRVIELINQHSNSKAITINNKQRKAKVTIDHAHESFADVLGVVSAGLNAYLVGPAGSGKTTIAEHCAKALGLEFHFTGAVLQKYELLGFIDAGGTYQRTAFRDAFENGGVFLFDEMDASSAQALIAFNAAIANKVCAFPDAIVKAHPDFIVIAASNTNGQGATEQYVRNKLDAATLDRYVFINVGYDETLESVMAAAICDEGADVAARVQMYRLNAKTLGINELVSPRATLQAAKLLAAGISWEKAFDMALFNKMSDDNKAALKSA